jgi:hypothetical protein
LRNLIMSLFVMTISSTTYAALYSPAKEFKAVYSCETLSRTGKSEASPMFVFWFHIHYDGETTTVTDPWFTYTSYKDMFYPVTYNREPTTTVMVSAKKGNIWKFTWLRIYPAVEPIQSREIAAEFSTTYKKGKLTYTSRDKLKIKRPFKCVEVKLQ